MRQAEGDGGFFGHEATIKANGPEWFAITKDRAAPREFTVRWAEIGLPPLTLVIQIRDDGKPICRSIEVDASELEKGVSTALLRDIPVRRIVREALASASLLIYRGSNGEIRPDRAPTWDERKSFVSEGPRRITAPIASDVLLRQVAEVYRANPDAPAKAVHRFVNEKFGASRATAGRYIAAARKKGILGRAEPRKAGEQGQ